MVWAISPFLRLIEASIAETHNDLDAKDPSELQASLEPATDIAQISEFFKDNPWGIAKKNVGGRDWWVWERKTPIYLIPADSGTPLFYKSGASIEAELLLIPIPAGTNPILFIDLKDYTVKPKDGFSNCDFPSYFVVPKLPKAESKLLPNPIIIPDNGDKDKYVPVPIGIEPDDKSDPFRALLYADGGLGNIAGISVALHPKCASTYNLYNVRKDDKDHFTEETHHYYPSVRIQEQEVEVENKQCIIVDTSASMGSVDINYLAKKGAEAVIDFVTSEALEEKPRLIKDGDIILYGLNLRSQHQGIALNPAEFVNSDGIDRARNSGGGIRRSDVAGFIDSEKLFERIAAELKKMVDSGDVFVGPDAAPESLKSVIDGCNNGYAYLTDTWPDFRSLPPAILVEDGNFLREEEGGLYLSSPGKMINFSLSSGEPLIITSQLVDFYENSEVPPSQKALEAQEFLKGHKVDVKVLEEKKSDPVL
ncbi:MAG: hypothetical protein HYU98_00020, partial [Deltaproteobacteria bacterium]|nr:hypothetical protein [Deltaproteobacteria bacterium]